MISFLVQKEIELTKLNISTLSKRNFLLERDVQYLDGKTVSAIQSKTNISEVLEILKN